MGDVLTAKQRHKCMSHNRSKNTRPEIIVRQWLWAQGFRYRIHVRRMPGSPDIVLFPLRVAIFINGCFWHGHNVRQLAPKDGEKANEAEIEDSPCCRIPRSNRLFWLRKINNNIARDYKNSRILRRHGWTVLTIWECMLHPKSRAETLTALCARLAEIKMDMMGVSHGAHPEPVPYSEIKMEEGAGMVAECDEVFSSYGGEDDGEDGLDELWEML